MRRILKHLIIGTGLCTFALVFIALLAQLVLGGSGQLGTGRARIMIAHTPATSAADFTAAQQWLDNRLGIEVIGLTYNGAEIVILYR